MKRNKSRVTDTTKFENKDASKPVAKQPISENRPKQCYIQRRRLDGGTDEVSQRQIDTLNTKLNQDVKKLDGLVQTWRHFSPESAPFRNSNDDPVCILTDTIASLTKTLISRASTGDSIAASQMWETSFELIKGIHLLSEKKPDLLRPVAKKSLFVPSLRSKRKKFTHNFNHVAEKIGLSEECYVNTQPNARYNLNKAATFFVAEKLEAAGRIRDRMQFWEDLLKGTFPSWHPKYLRVAKKIQNDYWELGFDCDSESKASFSLVSKFAYPGVSLAKGDFWTLKLVGKRGATRDYTLDDWLVEFGGFRPEDLELRTLPAFDRNSWKEWYQKAIKPFLEAPGTLKLIQETQTQLYREVKSRAADETDYDIIDELRQTCEPKVESLAPPAP
jgi:hypothetical protein